MALEIRYFAGVREMLDCREETLDYEALPDAPTLGDVWQVLLERHPTLEKFEDHLRLALDEEFADRDAPVEDGAVVALIPPVSGGSGTAPTRAGDDETASLESERFRMTTAPLETAAVRRRVERSEAGAIVTFEGVVRDHTDDRRVERLVYEAYLEMALDKLRETAREAEKRWPETEVAIHHRYGELVVGESAVVIAVSSPHRREAFEAAQYTIDRLKEEVPIWKKEIGPEGEEWIGSGP